jgi:hypothetical protein
MPPIVTSAEIGRPAAEVFARPNKGHQLRELAPVRRRIRGVAAETGP